MSETRPQEAPATEPSQTEPTLDQSALRTTPAQDTAPPPGTEQNPPDDGQPAEPPKPTPDPRDRTIRQLAFDKRETQRKLAAAQEQLQRLQSPPDPNAPPSQEALDRMVEQRAQALNDQREAQAQTEAWVGRGNAEYTAEVFTAHCNALAEMGAGENPAFMATIGKLDDGQKVVADLADNPAEATRVLQMAPVDLALALAGISARIAATPPPPPKPTSQAPPPIRPLTTAARAEVNLGTLDGDAFRDAWNKRTRSK